MKRLVLFGSILALLLAGCFRSEETIKINADGTGTIELILGMSTEMVELMEMMSEDSDQNPVPYEDKLKKSAKEEAKKMGEGVEFKNIKKETKGKMICYTSVYTFKDVTRICLDLSEVMKQPGEKNKPDSKKRPVTFWFRKLPDGSAELTFNNPFGEKLKERIKESIKEDKNKKSGPDRAPDKETPEDKEAKEMLKEMRVAFTLVCGSRIIETNATSAKDNRVVIMELDLGKLMKDEVKFKKLEKELGKLADDPVERTKELKKIYGETDGYTMELEDKVSVKFK